MEGLILRGTAPDGSGYGYGYGYGNGDRDGYGYGSYWKAAIKAFAAKWPKAQHDRLDVLVAAGATLAFWLSDARGRACNGGSTRRVAVGTVETTKGPLNLCSRGTLHATLNPLKWKGERWWIVALTGAVVGDEEKYGALSREIIGECL